jgi:hypothetical protein
VLQSDYKVGDCFFDSISALISSDEPGQHTLQLRRLTAQCFLDNCLHPQQDWTDWGDILNSLSGLSSDRRQKDLPTYIQGIGRLAEERGIWADSNAAKALGKAISINVTIYQHVNGELSGVSFEGPSPDLATAHLLFRGGTDGGHYIPLLKADNHQHSPLQHLLPLPPTPMLLSISSRDNVLEALRPASEQLEQRITDYTMEMYDNDIQAALQASQTLCNFCLPRQPTQGEGSGGTMQAAMGGGKQQQDPTAGNVRQAAAPKRGKRREETRGERTEPCSSKKRR